MIKSKQKFLMYLSFSFSIFDFTTTLLNNVVFTYEWVMSIAVSSILSFLVMNVIMSIKKTSKILNWVLIIYSFKIIIQYLFRFSNYIDEVHSTNSIFSLSILTSIIVVYLFKFHKESFERIAPLILFITIIMLGIAFILNMNKMQVVNVYVQEKVILLNVNIVKVYDWVIPFSLLYTDSKNKNKEGLVFITVNAVVLIGISVFRGLCIRGEMLYSLSPLHSIFSVSKGITIQRFDYLFTMMLIVCFFAVLLLNIALVNKIRTDAGNVQNKTIALLFILALVINAFSELFTNIYLVFVLIVLILAKSLRERRKNEN